MNKLDPFEGDEEGSDGEVNPPAAVSDPDSVPQVLMQYTVHTMCVAYIGSAYSH